MSGKADPEALEKAAEILEQRGWCQGRYEDSLGRLCYMGALKQAIFGTAHPTIQPDSIRWTSGWMNYTATLRAAMARKDSGDDCTDHVAKWNDTPGRTAAEVIDHMKMVAKDLRNRATPE